ncbi:MAG: hypothetical protein K2X47_12010, partial [Bdellovibrionales bacterium]|nr:hypothetical protein [Bdellovibrionales bacterium]
PVPIAYLINGALLLFAIELVDWMLLKKYGTAANQEANSDLASMTATDLIRVEDQLFHQVEMDSNRKTAWVAGRFVVFALSGICWLLTLALLEQGGVFKKLAGNPLSIPVYLGSLFIGVLLGNWVWKAISHWGRFSVRTLIHYWPMVIYVGVGISYLLRHLRAVL